MDLKSRENKKKSKRRFINSFGYAFEGIKYAFIYEQNIIVHFLMAIVVGLTGFILKISPTQWMILIIVIGLVMALELVNSAVEAMVDLATDKYHVLAKVAKDCSSGAVLIMSFAAVLIGMIIFLPKLIEIMKYT